MMAGPRKDFDMPMHRVRITQTRTYWLEIEAENAGEAEGKAEARYREDDLPNPDLDHDTFAYCAGCGDDLLDDENTTGLCRTCQPAKED